MMLPHDAARGIRYRPKSARLWVHNRLAKMGVGADAPAYSIHLS
jgi:hypothetical protein